jgi:hypothetical protein
MDPGSCGKKSGGEKARIPIQISNSGFPKTSGFDLKKILKQYS